ncbi:DCC1-like thiol-disulfide oxidoreductase family protein [Sulfurovum sp.]|jgi:predicted DCC family thiol-disulfide oxidoreductase YuxK|uniref:DCC1-like thiol-disulfide oxidoreductase family protein n=1 Tax=Sulfurovum sp. TaxID=1969726 RepID=UPI002A371C02|nr:DCC1-like thiol-disulfide oxidoreductase family protein [Sulfurovum sp.]MDY0403899.1 DCC1-like thiol-disulfide oxidoreductase family protein [Sulfurovum sp.]
MKPMLTLYYDKECPFCNRYACFLELKKSHELHLINARESLQKIRTQCPHLDINDGMILVTDGRCLQGREALAYLDTLITRNTLFGKLHRIWRLAPWLTLPLYSVIKLLRRIVLFFMGKKSDIE